MFYTILDNQLLTANNQEALTRFYDNVMKLPSDYETDKYIVKDGKLVLNPEWEEINLNNKKASIRGVRNQYLEEYVDPLQLVIRWGTLSEQEQTDLVKYRQYLLDYTAGESWWENNPMDFETWKQSLEVVKELE